MSGEQRIEALRNKHHSLETAINDQNIRPNPDEYEIASLKKQKLRIKDEIADLEGA
jgi:hypothetical protein